MCFIDLFSIKHRNNIKNVIIDKYKVRKIYQEGWFTTKESITEEQCYTAKMFLSNGIISRKEVIDESNSYYKKTRDSYIYDNGRLVKRISTIACSNEEYTEEETFEYIKIGGVYYESKIVLLKNGILRKESEYKYNNKGDLIESLSIKYMSDGRYIDSEFYGKYDWEYDKIQLTKTMIGSHVSSYDKKTTKKKKVYKYNTIEHYEKDFYIEVQEFDDNSNLLCAEYKTYDECNRVIFSKRNGRIREQKFNDNGELIYRKWDTHYLFKPFDEKEKVITSTYEYQYDSYKNWVECRYYEDGVYKMLFIRKIDYSC